jgi:hypothetical protein
MVASGFVDQKLKMYQWTTAGNQLKNTQCKVLKNVYLILRNYPSDNC